MNFEKAKTVDLRFGKFKGKTLEEIGKSDDGLLYLDWLIGNDWPNDYLKAALAAFLTDASISKEVDKALENRKAGKSSSGKGSGGDVDPAALKKKIDEYNASKKKLREEANEVFGGEGGSDNDTESEEIPF